MVCNKHHHQQNSDIRQQTSAPHPQRQMAQEQQA